MRKLIVGSVSCVTLLMLAWGTSASSVELMKFAGAAPPPDIDEAKSSIELLHLAGAAPPPDIDEVKSTATGLVLLAGAAPPPDIDERA